MYKKVVSDENYFRKLEKAVRKYNMFAYKKLIFEYYPGLLDGTVVGEEIGFVKTRTLYRLPLPTDKMFKSIHGEIALIYSIDESTETLYLEYFEPENILMEGHFVVLDTYKGTIISKKNADRDIFKIELLEMLGR